MMANLKETAAQVPQQYCWFTTLTDIKENGPMALIWGIVGKNGKMSLLEFTRKEVET